MDLLGPTPASGTGTIVQLVVRSLTTSPVSRTKGSWSRPARRGIEVVEQARRAPGPTSPIARAAQAPELEDPLAVPRRHEVERVLVGVRRIRARLTCMSKYATSTNFAPWR